MGKDKKGVTVDLGELQSQFLDAKKVFQIDKVSLAAAWEAFRTSRKAFNDAQEDLTAAYNSVIND